MGRRAFSMLLLATAACMPAEAPPTRVAQGSQSARCAAMVGATPMPGVTVTSAKRVPEAAPNTVRLSSFGPETIPAPVPAHCLVQGMIDPHTGSDGTKYGLEFALALPEEWNGRFLFQGGGGFNGSLSPPLGAAAAGNVPAIARNFAVVSTDGGHKGAVFDGAFMNNQRAALDFYHRSVGRVTEVAKEIVTHFYGRAPHHSYIAGCSTGGREAMLATQRYPLMFDGAIVGAPAMRAGQSRIGGAVTAAAYNRIAPKDAGGKPQAGRVFSAADRKLLKDSLIKSCDAGDGLADGLIHDPAGCRFDPAELTCRAGKQDGCLSKEQVGALKTAAAGPRDSRGRQVYPGFWWDTGLLVDGPMSLLPSDAPSVLGPPDLSLEADVDELLRRVDTAPGDRLTDTYFWDILNGFTDHGGRILFFHGVSDPWFSAQDTAEYHQRVNKVNGDVSRYYLVPGMGHCSGGQALDRFDLLTALVDWVEKGSAPASIVASGPAFPGRTRPLCPYPKVARYNGSGNSEDAASFTCR